LNLKIQGTPRTLLGVWMEPEYVGKEFKLKCPLDNQEVEDVMEAAVEVAEVENVDPLVEVVEAEIVEATSIQRP